MRNENQYEIPWDKNLDTGIEWIDQQHKQLLKNIENLVNAFIVNSDEENIKNVIDFLKIYVHTHFNAEQNYMNQFKYRRNTKSISKVIRNLLLR